MDAQTKQKLQAHRVIPDILPLPPKAVAQVFWPVSSQEPDIEAELGNAICPKEVEVQPQVKFPAAEKQLFTIAVIDPDSPSKLKPSNGQWLHWLVTNVPGSSTKEPEISKGNVLVEWEGPKPAEGTGLHRYILVVFEQKGKTDAAKVANRAKFDVMKWAKLNGKGAWNLLAANYWQSSSTTAPRSSE